MALNYLDKAAWDAGVYKDKGNDDDTQQDTSSEDSGFSASGILSAAKNFLEHPFQGTGTVIAPNYTPRPLDDSVYSDIPGAPVASGQFGELEDESVRDERMKDSADYMAANWPRLYGGVVAADEGLANVVGGIQNAVGGGNGILTNVQRAEEGMQDYRDQWNNEYGDSYFLNPNKFATDAGSVIGSSVPIMALSALMPGAAVAGGTRALTSALSRAGLGRLAMSKAGQALIADTVRSIPTSNLADSLSEYGTVVNDMMQNGVSEDEARRRAIPMFFKNMALDTFTVPLELGVMKGGKGIATGLLGRSAEEGVAKSIAKGAARTGMLAGASGLTEGYQEGAQNALENDVQGKRDGGWYNPLTWTNEDWEAARGGFVGGALMGVPGNVAAGFHPEAEQAPLSAESQEQAQSIKDTLSHGKPAGMSNAAYNAYIELANSGNPDLIKQAASSLESLQQSQEGSQESTDDAAAEAYKDYEAYDQKQEIENFLNNNTVEQIGGEKNFNWLMGVLRNGTPEEVQHAYDTVIAAEKATAEQETKNRPASGGGSMSPNTGNAMANIVIQAANDSGVEPRLGLAIAARESGGDDVNAISMPEPHDGVYGVMQAQEETVSNMGLDSQYPDWKTDPYQNAMVGMAILKAKIDGENGDVWAGVRDYDGAGEEAEQYRQLVKNNYDNMGDIGGGGSGNVEAPSEAFYDLSEAMNPQVDGMDPNTMAKMNLLAHDFYQKYGHRLLVTSLKRNDDDSSYHDEGHAFDFSDDFLEQNPDARDWLVQQGEKYGLKGLDEFSHPVATTDGGNVHFTDHGGPAPGGASSGVSGKVTSDNGQFERELDQAAQEAKSDMDKIQAQSDQAMNEIMNDDSTEKTAQDAQQDAENAQKQAEEGQQSVQDDVVPDVAQTIRDTSSNIDEINALDGMFTKDSNGNDKFIDTPENRDFIKTNYKDEIAKAVNDAMNKKKAPSATPVPKSQQQTPHARLGRILSTYDRKDPKFKEYMNTFRNGTEQEQQKLADDLQTTQELERANFLKGNPLTTQQDQNIPQNVPQQAVEAPKQTEQVNTPVQEKESLETQKKRDAYLSKKQKLMERVPAGRAVKVHASTNDAGFDATYKIVPAGDITASHDMNYAVNDLYPAEYQPRDRNRPQMRGQVEKMTKGMKPELLAESQFVNEGAPVINNSGVVLNGNGRVMAVQKAYKGLADAHKKSAKAYKDYLVSIAPSLGIAPEKVQSMDHPVLVRQAADDADTNAIINSTEGGAKLGGAEQAKGDADRLKLSTLEQFVDNRQAEPAGSGRVHQQEAGRVQSQEKEGNEVDEKSKQSDHVDTEPQQTESKDKESTHAEEGSQGDVQEEISKFHNVLDDEKSTPKQVIDAYKSVVDKVIASADGSRKNAKMGDKIVTDEYQSLTNSKHWNAFMNEDGGRKKYLPGSKTEGTGGKANDYQQEKATDFDRAKAVYFGKQKKNSRTKSQEGHDYFATPEPIGYKMVQWLQSKPGQSLLEPSAGDGAIARWMPDNTYNTVVEPSRDLTPKLMRNVAGAKVVESTFENFDLHNKFDGIAMNPPFGHGGKTAVEHVAKAYKHLKDGGRLIAIIPDGPACQKRFDKWFYGDPEAKRKADRGIADGVLMADIHLPSVTFEREGTNVNTRMVVIDKYTDEGTRQVAEAEARGRIDIAADDVNELFDRIEGMDMPERLDMSDEKKQASIRKAGQQLTRSKEDLKAEIKDAFPTAKEIKDEGDRMTFTMPNGSHIVVDLKNEILLTDEELAQAKKDHHIDDNGNVIVEGYAEVRGKDAYMALSQGSRENTGFHEAYHLAEGAVLTDREKTAIKKAIPDAEKRADKYAEWVEARKHGRGTAWGKLFQKIKDFAAKMRKIFTRVESVHDVFRQIESGEVWERNAKTSNVAWTSVTNTAITGKTRVPIVDVSNWGRMNLTDTAKKKAIIEELKGASFKFIDSQGRFATKLDSKHFVNSSSSIQIHLKTRQKIFSNIGEILNNAIYVEKHPDVRHGKSGEYIELFSAVKDGGKIVLFRIVAKEGDKTVGRYNIGDVKFYDILQQKKDVPHHLSHSDRQNGGTSLNTVSVSDLLRNVNDRHNRPYVNSDGTLNYEFGVLKALPTNKTSYSVRKEGATNSTIDQEEAPVKPQDIIDAINDIVHIYEGSRLTDKERKELREASQFDPDQKQAVRPQATDLYDRHAHAGFNRMGYFNLSNYGRILALHLDNVMQLKGNLELANKVLDRQDKNAAENKMNGVNERLTPAQARQNAVMDFGAMMIRNPELARETYPAYSKIFDEGLEQHPDLKEKLDKVIQLNETYQGQTAAERAAGSIAREKGKVQLRKHPKEWLSTHFDKFYTNWVDDKHAFAKVVARAEAELGRKLAYDYDVHKQAQMAINVASSRALLFLTGGKGVEETYKVLNKVYGHAITKNVTMKDIMDALNKVSKEDVSKTGAENAYDALGNYLIAMRTEELEKHYHDAYARSAGFDEEGTREIIQNTPESIKKIAQMYWDINTNIVNILQQQGLISKDLAGKLRKYKHYCPMYRDMSGGITDMDEMIGTIGVFNKGGGYANVSNGIKRIEGGGKRPILDPITSLSQMAVSMISKCERNDVAKTFVKLGQDFAGLGDVVVRDPTLKHADPTAFAFTVWQNGEQVAYRTTPEIYDALTNNDAQTNRFTIKMASSIAQTLRTGATISPSFIVRNLLRDTMSATVNSKTGFYLPFVDNVRGAWKLHFDKEFSAEYHASGASMSTYMRADADSSRDLTKELLGHKYDSYPVVVKQVRQLISYAWHKYEKFGNLIEDSTRAGEFRRARNQGLSIDQAGQLAREITLDFSRHGKKGQMINKYVPFFNATIQGTDKFIRTFKDNPMRAILNTVIWIILPSLGLWAINHDDDWYKELDENTKYTNWAIPLPGGTHLLIPKPQEVGILFGSGIEAVLNQMTGTDPHGMKEWARQYAEAMTPSLYPAVVRPLIEWMTNYSFWTGRNLVPASLQKAPSEMQFTSYTSELAKSLGDTWLAKSIKLSPIAIDNWIGGWFGSAGRFVANMLNDPISYVRGNSRPSEPAKYWYEMPVIGSFVRQNGQNSEYINRMYEIQKDMNDDYERSDAGKQRKGKKSSSNKPKELKQVDTAVSSVSKLNKEIKAIRNDPKKDPDRKRQEIDQRRTKINDLAKKVVLKFDK